VTSAAAGGTTAAGGTSAAGGSVLATTSEIPVGGGKVFASAKVVVTQPSANTFKGFSAICTHMQCTVDQVANGTIDCPCHGSKFSIKDGSVVGGPAPSPLPAASIAVNGTNITLSAPLSWGCDLCA
jgi:Rieske Fe-S protein